MKFLTIRVEGAMQNILSTEPLQKLCVELFGPLPTAWDVNKYIFVVLDNFTRFVCLYPMKKATALIVTNRMMDQFVKVHGKPTTIVSDHGVQFISRVWQSRLTELGIQVSTTSVYHPQSNPSERVM
ncbi:Ribonuclease H-like domain,Integrase, catalytic core [Cinara cedri]|uniref:Ribonuclease H-like domain,Integrase, catalytic core n=1 Tax=Cinara cedri TaxID=506608 RepID=A0A5E4MI46_9HEMI|nr:Ribonuclease H-like domain,Integrase, catalytic core [Cinara cedri]